MDSVDEDVSARVLLRKVLHTELPRTPVTRSATHARRSVRLKNTPGLESPGVALRHRLKQKLHQTAQSPLPPPKRQRSLGGKTNPPAAATPSLFDDDITTRGLLRGIIQMDPEASLLMSGQPAPQEAEPNPESSVSSAGERTEGLSGVELSDLTLHTEPLTHVVRKLSRRKPQRVFSVSAFENQLDQLPDKSVEEASVFREKSDVSHDLDSSAGSRSGLNLTLKTPFVDKRTERAGLQRKVSNRRLPSVDVFDEAVQRCMEQAPDPDHSQFQDGKTLEDSSWQKFTLGLSDVTELYVQPAGSTVQMKKDDTAVQDAEPERDAESNDTETEEYQELKLSYVDEIHDVPESIIQENKDHEVESALQDEEEMLPSSQEEADDVSLSPEDEIMLAPTQAMTEAPPESKDAETHEPETEEDPEKENVQEDMDTLQGLEQITRRAHRSEGGRGVLGIQAGQRVTKSLGAGLNPREKDFLEFVNRTGESLQHVPDEEMEPLGSHLSPPLNLTIEVTTEQRSQQHDASLDGENLLDVEGAEITTSEQRSRHETSLTGRDLPEVEATTSEQGSRHDTSLTGKEQGSWHETSLTGRDLPEVEATTSEQGSRHDTSLTGKEQGSWHETILTGRDLPEVKATTSEQGSRHDTSLTGKEQGSWHETSLTGKDLPEAEATTSEQGSRHETSLTGKDLPDIEGDDLQEEESQSEDEDMMDSEPANQSPEPHSPALGEQEDDDDDDARSAELSMKTPAFVKQKRVIANANARATPTVLKELNSGPVPQVTKRRPRQKRGTGSDVLPKSYVMSVFKHFAKTKVASDVYPAINEILKKYFERLADDLEVYATHAKRKTIEIEDFELLMRRQGFVTDSMPVNMLIEKYLPLEYRKLLIPVATSGNKVVPNQRR